MTPTDTTNQQAVRDTVRAGYARIAEGTPSAGGCGTNCCGGSATGLSEHIGYDRDALASLPDGADMGLSCGNPIALATLRPGEVVLDLGSGGGFDCFLAGPKVGPTGRVIGVDMTAEMVAKARRNIPAYQRQSGLSNVEFRLGEIEHLPLADGSVDVVISNCVLNLSPDKAQVWREIARVLAPGGRVAVSDLALLGPLPEEIREMVEALVGCVAGAVPVEDTRRLAEAAGLGDVVLTPKPSYVEAMTTFQDPLYQRIVAALPPGAKLSDFLTSLDVSARASAKRPATPLTARCGGAAECAPSGTSG
jgi:SAM-dependent methyltransferase